MLLSKTLKSLPIPLSETPQHETFPDVLEILVTGENVETVEKSLSVSVGPNRLDT